jgi:POT family proton-dependent oligopeptide transporter
LERSTVTTELKQGTESGHPKGLYSLFFTEMWERLAFYLMLGILVLYATDNERGGLGLSNTMAAEIYGTYLAFVYFTPFLGGLIADRYLGYRRSVFIGGLLMAAGLFMLGVRGLPTLYGGLTLICLGNGLFKPNISAMVGNLYEPGDPKRDAGFNIFYMGINTGASLSAILCAPLRNAFSFNVAFVGAGVGLLVGVTILTINWKRLARADRQPVIDPRDASLGRIVATILLPAALFGAGGYFVGDNVGAIKSTLGPITFAFITGMIPVMFYFISLVLRAGPEEKPGLAALMPVYVAGGAFFMILHLSGGLMTFFTEHDANRRGEWVPGFARQYYTQKAMPSYYRNADSILPRPHEDSLLVTDTDVEAMFGARRISQDVIDRVQRQYPDVKALDVKADKALLKDEWRFLSCKVYQTDQVRIKEGTDAHGTRTVSISVEPETAAPLRSVVLVRVKDGESFPVILVTQEMFASVYKRASESRLGKGEFTGLLNAELVTGLLNPLLVVALTPVVVAFFAWRIRRGKPIGTAHKILYGMIITFLSLLVMAGAACSGGDGQDKVGLWWLVIYYVVITTGELCLSPMGLSLVTKLSPKRLVGLMLGGWFLATAIGNKLAGFISGLAPTTKMFIVLSLAPLAVAMVILLMLPMLDRAIKKYRA